MTSKLPRAGTKGKPKSRGTGLPHRILTGKLSSGPGSKLSGSRKFTPVFGVATVMLLLIVMWSPMVEAGETRTVDGWIRIDPDLVNMTVNYTWNASDPSNSYLYNWNQTVDPFEQNNSLNGSFTGTFLPPIEFQVTQYINTLTLCGLVKFKSTWIMSGSSESWWRIPIQGPGWGDSTNLTLWHIDSPATLNVTDLGTPNNISHPTKVFDQDFDMDVASLNQSVRYWNGTAWDRDFTSTWVRVGAQIHTDEFYLVRWVIHNNGDNYDIRFSSTDQCEDRVSRTWVIYDNGTKVIYDADVDYSVLHILGMGYAVWGEQVNEDGPDYLLEDDMENADGTAFDVHNPDYYDYEPESGTIEIDTDQAAGGSSSLYFDYPSGPGPYCAYDTPMASGIFTVEFDVRADQTYSWLETLVASEESGTWAAAVRFAYPIGRCTFWYGNGAGSDNQVVSPANSVIRDQWHHIRMDVDVDDDSWRGWLDGTYYPGPNADSRGFDNFYHDFTFNEMDFTRIWKRETTADAWFDNLEIYQWDSVEVEWNTELNHNITAGEYLTIMVPFLDVVDNETNVLITFGTQNDSWSTGFWVAADGPTNFGLESVQWDVGWGATDMKISMTIYNATRSLWIMDTNPEFDPDWTWELNRYTVDGHTWAPDDYYFGGVPYYSLQVTNGSWENTHPTGSYFLQGREVDPDQIMKKRQDSDSWLVEIWLTGYEGISRGTASFTFAITGQWDKAWDALDPSTPFPLDAPWYLGKYWFKGLAFLTELGNAIWVGLVWLYEVGQWIVENASWIFAGVLTLMVLLIVPPIWKRFFQLNWGLIRFGWILARDGVIAASDYADEFWKEFVATSYLKKVAKRLPTRGG